MKSGFGDMPPLSDLIEGIEKVKFFNYQTDSAGIDAALFSELMTDIEGEGYEVLMSGRVEGANMQLMMKQEKGDPEGFVVMIKMPDQYSILDIEGYPDINNILKFSEFINKNSKAIGIAEAFD